MATVGGKGLITIVFFRAVARPPTDIAVRC